MNDQSRVLVNAVRGPIIMITVGVLFAADKMTPYHFGQTWPVLMIVIGLMQLVGGRRRRPDYYAPPAASSSSAPPPRSPYENPPAVSTELHTPTDSGEPRI
jgi:hypothetical protein